jgi:glutamate N-acetyltransferase/amino-acid N-acetyltransferase
MQHTLTSKMQDHSITCPAGFEATGLACGIKPSGADDLAVIVCPNGAAAAGVFTRNLVHAAPIDICREHLARSGGSCRALIINSGCANAATGPEGRRRAEDIARSLAGVLSCPVEQILMNSTGVIGVQLPHELIIEAMPRLVSTAEADGLHRAARAIMTTDTALKMTQRTDSSAGRSCRVVGIAKGAGMIHPNMATMIGVIMTDAAIDAPALDAILRRAVDRSFHRITIDGDTSTNDAVYLLASGEAGEFPAESIEPAIHEVCRDLATQIVRDGEGATKLIHVKVNGGRTAAEALQVAQTVASSLLVRTSIAGGDPNWGRILAAAGRSGVDLDPDRITLRVNDLLLFENGSPSATPRDALVNAYRQDEVVLDIDLQLGDARDEFFTCDLTEGYVQVNAEYTS